MKIKCNHKNVTKWDDGLRQCNDCLSFWYEPQNSPTASSLHSENIICVKEENQK